MKKPFPLLILFPLLAALLPPGSAKEPIPEPAALSAETTQARILAEISADGALQIYPLNRSDAVEVVRMGEDLLLFSGEKATTLTKLSGDNRYISAVANLNCLIRTTNPAVKVSTIS